MTVKRFLMDLGLDLFRLILASWALSRTSIPLEWGEWLAVCCGASIALDTTKAGKS